MKYGTSVDSGCASNTALSTTFSATTSTLPAARDMMRSQCAVPCTRTFPSASTSEAWITAKSGRMAGTTYVFSPLP
ncbi:hypothetical protein G6F59_018563 [Rhizopus arrhizus]|nr:hypothetical protein G6F59_018563 [Rhizopus arrhizus]